jgi:hypothetical protein
MAGSVYSRTLSKAAELIGGPAKLCRHLRVPADELQKWLEDRAAPPIGVFLRAVDLILEETPAPGGGSEPPEPAAPRDCAPAEGSASRY